jgi:S1-C subfamily serine protease
MASLAAKSIENAVVLKCRVQRYLQGRRNSGRMMRSCLLIPLFLVCQNLAVLGDSAPQVSNSARRGNSSREMSAETIFRRFANRVLTLTCDESVEESKLASGVLVSADGFILTNAHVVEGCRSMTAVHISGESRQSYVPVLKYCDELNDVAVLKIVGKGFDFFALPAHSPQIGERVFAIGNPRGLEQSISEGIVSGNREMDGTAWIQHSAPISPGSSGGALISARGELVGINSRMLEQSQNLNFAVPSVTLAAALSRARARDATLTFPQSGDEQFSIGMLYVRGQGVPQDYAEAAKWIQQAADKGHAEAQATLGGMFLLGKGEPQDYAQAAEWLRKAAEQGFLVAQLALGHLLSEGQGVPKNDAEAVMWWHRAAEQGNATAQINLAAAYQLGTGVRTDNSEAYFWYKVASAGEIKDVTPQELAEVLKTIGSKLSPEALSGADQRARKWLADHPADTE